MENLNEFMFVFRLKPSNEQPSPEALKVMHEQWGGFIGNIASQAKLVSTTRLGFGGKQIDENSQITEGIYLSNGETISGNMVLKAESLDEAVEIAKACPILNMGGNVEIRETLAM